MFGKKKSEYGVPKDPIERLVNVLLLTELDSNERKIIFGEPCDGLPKCPECIKLMAEKNPEEIDALLEETEFEYGPKVKMVPAWNRRDGAWHKGVDIQWWLLQEVVHRVGEMIALHQTAEQRRNCAERVEATVPLDRMLNRGFVKVLLTLALEPNYCYSITLKKVE